MLRSLDRTAQTAGIALESVDLQERAPWGGKPLRQKAEAVGWSGPYDALFGGMSHNVHGSWQDLYDHHLEADGEGRFTPAFEWSRPRPQLAFALGVVVVEAVRDVFGFLGGAPALALLSDKLADLDARIREADGAHERYLSMKRRSEA